MSDGSRPEDAGAGPQAHVHDDAAMELRVRALRTLLVAKGYVDPAALDAIIDSYESRIGPRNGARVIARAWTSEAFRRWLLQDGMAAIASLGYCGVEGARILAVANTQTAHNLVVCTLCSCYPWPVLGLPPVWYKSAPYRARAVKDPRGLLAEFGLDLPAATRIRVWDSTAEVRYLVVPERPAGAQGLGEEELASWVTRDSMIGTGLPRQPDSRR